MNEILAGFRKHQFKKIEAHPETKPATKTENRETATQQIAEQMIDIANEFGVEALQIILAKMQTALTEGRGLEAGELAEVIKEKATRSEFQETALKAFEGLGFVEQLDNGTVIVDDQKLLSEFSLSQLRDVAGEELAKFGDFKTDRITFLGNAFADKQVILKNDWKQNPETQPKPLFYLPNTRQESLDIDRIRAADFHYGLWEIPQASKGAKERIEELSQPASATEQNYFETSLAAVIYHPKFGDAQRDEQGKLHTYQSGEKKAISGQWLWDQGLKMKFTDGKRELRSNAKEVIQEFAPNIIENSLLQAQDFGLERSVNRSQETARVSNNGVVSIGGVKHYLGRAYAGRAIRIDEIGDGTAALVELADNGQGTPVGLIDIYKKGDPRLSERKTNTGSFFEAGGKITHPRAFSEAEYQSPKPNEDPDVFFARKQKFEAFNAVLDFDNVLKSQGYPAMFSLSPELQGNIRNHGNQINKNKQLYLNFIDSYGKPGLEIMAAVIDNSSIAEKTLETALALPETERNTLIPRLHEALLARHVALNELKALQLANKVTDLEVRKFTFEINRRVTSLLTAAEDSAGIREGLNTTNKSEVLKLLVKQGQELALFANIFKDAFKGSPENVMEGLKGVELKVETCAELSDLDKTAILDIHAQNWKQKPDVYPKLRKALEIALESNTSKAYVMKNGHNVTAFMRFDQVGNDPNQLYAASLLVKPGLRGSAIGESFMRAAMDECAEDHILKADFFPEFIVGTTYVEQMGWVITGVEEVDIGNGKTAKQFMMERNDRKNLDYVGKSNKDLSKSKGLNIQTIDVRNGTAELIQAVEQAQVKGQVVTRYFADRKNPNLRTMVFENRQDEQMVPQSKT
ncbi:MAG: GNAT family N-acetyltransferase [Patescibacteria group bacterium]